MAGLYGRAESCARGARVYLLPGLTVRQRRTALRRLRQEASRGFGPALPLTQLAIALTLDRVRTAARIVGAMIRLHPAVTLVPGAFVVAMMTLFVIASGERPGGTPSPRGGLAEAAAIGGGIGAVGAGSSRARTTQVTAADGPAGTDADGSGLGSGQPALLNQARGEYPKGNQPVPAFARPGSWCTGPQAMITSVPRPRDGQLACRRPVPRAVPHTSHLPGPRDFAS
jgi:hypothetical protein